LVLTSDARVIVGIFVGHDQVQNVIMNDAHERVYSEDEDVEMVPLGLYVIRGDNVCLIGEYDATKLQDDQRIHVSLAEIRQQQY
jgi:U6 snRNA-associated Sm-like protein LSm8